MYENATTKKKGNEWCANCEKNVFTLSKCRAMLCNTVFVYPMLLDCRSLKKAKKLGNKTFV